MSSSPPAFCEAVWGGKKHFGGSGTGVPAGSWGLQAVNPWVTRGWWGQKQPRGSPLTSLAAQSCLGCSGTEPSPFPWLIFNESAVGAQPVPRPPPPAPARLLAARGDNWQQLASTGSY